MAQKKAWKGWYFNAVFNEIWAALGNLNPKFPEVGRANPGGGLLCGHKYCNEGRLADQADKKDEHGFWRLQVK